MDASLPPSPVQDHRPFCSSMSNHASEAESMRQQQLRRLPSNGNVRVEDRGLFSRKHTGGMSSMPVDAKADSIQERDASKSTLARARAPQASLPDGWYPIASQSSHTWCLPGSPPSLSPIPERTLDHFSSGKGVAISSSVGRHGMVNDTLLEEEPEQPLESVDEPLGFSNPTQTPGPAIRTKATTWACVRGVDWDLGIGNYVSLRQCTLRRKLSPPRSRSQLWDRQLRRG
ncbi:hypothetical protein BD413DRAFT_212907 [Trametes elegans]|nr:hypothetical protein BD413DRAFT_212907 [Trametes elegans]